nr:MAG TPA: hypothetical protein [Caudoviricetes sp.]
MFRGISVTVSTSAAIINKARNNCYTICNLVLATCLIKKDSAICSESNKRIVCVPIHIILLWRIVGLWRCGNSAYVITILFDFVCNVIAVIWTSICCCNKKNPTGNQRKYYLFHHIIPLFPNSQLYLVDSIKHIKKPA